MDDVGTYHTSSGISGAGFILFAVGTMVYMMKRKNRKKVKSLVDL